MFSLSNIFDEERDQGKIIEALQFHTPVMSPCTGRMLLFLLPIASGSVEQRKLEKSILQII
jgi:hypothetical protein